MWVEEKTLLLHSVVFPFQQEPYCTQLFAKLADCQFNNIYTGLASGSISMCSLLHNEFSGRKSSPAP